MKNPKLEDRDQDKGHSQMKNPKLGDGDQDEGYSQMKNLKLGDKRPRRRLFSDEEPQIRR